MENQKRGVLTLTNVQRFGVGAAVGAALITNANAAVDVAGPVATLTTDGTAAITAVGAALLGLADCCIQMG